MGEARGVVPGVLIQTLGPWGRLVAYLSKKLGLVTVGWSAFIKALTATTLLVKESDRLTLEHKLSLITLHSVEALLRRIPERWVSNAQVTP